jgi:hypothetical protein
MIRPLQLLQWVFPAGLFAVGAWLRVCLNSSRRYTIADFPEARQALSMSAFDLPALSRSAWGCDDRQGASPAGVEAVFAEG